jgi:hypothetical protein
MKMVVIYGSPHIIVMRLGKGGLSIEQIVLKLQSLAENLGLSPHLGLTSERYLNGSHLILGN